jgi:hypothetical protein
MNMSKQEASALAQFCADQYYAFDANMWRQRSIEDSNAAVLAAMYLAMTSWYGHAEQLERIAADSRAIHANGPAFQRAAQSNGLDLARFSASVRYAIALKRINGASGESQR